MERLKSVLFVVVLAICGLALTASPAMANCGPDYFVNPNNTADDTPWGEDTPWIDSIDRQGNDAWAGPQYMVMQVAGWLVDAGLIETCEDSQPQSTESGNRERNTAAGETSWKD